MKALLCAAILATTLPAFALEETTYTASWSGNQIIPDNNASGVAFPFNLSTPGPAFISSVSVALNLTGGWNGDLYAYLSHGSGFAVLLNRVGRTALDPDGSGASGFNISLADANAADIHNFSGSPVSGNFAPDARNVNPFDAVDTSPRHAPLSGLNGLEAGGSWTLFFADVAPASVATVQSWTVSVSVVPEPSVTALLSIAAALVVARRSFLPGMRRRADSPRR